VSWSRRIRSRIAETLILLSVVIVLVPLVLVIGYCVVNGWEALSIDFFTSDGEPDIAGNGIKHALVGTLIMMGVATVVAVPLGVLTALFLRECDSRGRFSRRLGAALGLYVDMLLGVPSIVAGLVISIAVVLAMGSFSALAGGLALALIMFPIVVRSSDEVLRLVPGAQVEAALALGAPRWRTTWSVILPLAAPGILTGVTLALARVSGETAPLLLTSLGAQFFATDLLQPIAALPQYIFTGTINSTVPVAQTNAWGAALVLVGLVLVLNLVARLLSRTAGRQEAR
jgi:phosphate transport system permease protein